MSNNKPINFRLKVVSAIIAAAFLATTNPTPALSAPVTPRDGTCSLLAPKSIFKTVTKIPTAENVLAAAYKGGISHKFLISLIMKTKTFDELAREFLQRRLLTNMPANEKEKDEFVELIKDIWFALTKDGNSMADYELYEPTIAELEQGALPAMVYRTDKTNYYIHPTLHDGFFLRKLASGFFRRLAEHKIPLYYEQNLAMTSKTQSGCEIKCADWGKKIDPESFQSINKLYNTIFAIGSAVIFGIPVIGIYTMSRNLYDMTITGLLLSPMLFSIFIFFAIIFHSLLFAYVRLRTRIEGIYAKEVGIRRDRNKAKRNIVTESYGLQDINRRFRIWMSLGLPAPLSLDETRYFIRAYNGKKEGRSAFMVKWMLDNPPHKEDFTNTNEIHILCGASHAPQCGYFLQHKEFIDKFMIPESYRVKTISDTLMDETILAKQEFMTSS